ncbi:septation ring formation regulator EzrA [Oceanobacillus chungangensis]|uniref:Septation ring formation regulator EzrA n=1 Tax=Oceanobacillus chungangensis TaxID=1229152 RepID=A0A3D8PZZ2_9BACI|nr:septation ring formation regulator EzrA [Oceanobacillus chungangensis]RDW21543.1 septation ring formation regulator EzrA [Oceanobacillus chungangensis]
MVYIIGAILIIIVILIVGLILRKRIYDGIDRLEEWKLDIIGRNIAAQISQIKNLNLSGETQDRFETWRDRWEHIITKELPDIEEYLLDTEEAADRFLVSKANKTLASIELTLESIEKDIDRMLKELDELLESEQTSRVEVEELEPSIKDIRKTFSRNRLQYGRAEIHFETMMDELDEAFAKYHELVGSGDYLEARELVEQIKRDKVALELKLEEFPAIYKKCRHELPSQLDNLLAGVKEMKEDGYHIEHLAFEKEIRTYHERLTDLMQLLNNGETDDAVGMIDEIDERIKEMYQLLEKEAIAKNYLETKLPGFEQSLEAITKKYDTTKEEVERLRKAYFFEDNDMEKYLSIGKSIATLNDRFAVIKNEMDDVNVGHSNLREKIENGFDMLGELEISHEAFKDSIANLRKDELEAREKLEEMRNELQAMNRKLKKSNIPGVPNFIWNSIENTTNKNQQVIVSLENLPLDMGSVQQALTDAKISLDQTIEQIEMMLDQAYLTEQVIQYANRYRSRNPILAAKLIESERLFKAYEYELALETAAKAIEEVEPGALKHIEENQTMIMN